MESWLFSPALAVLGFLLALVAIAHMVTQRRSPQSALAWLLAIILLPWIGVPLYLMFGGRKMAALARAKSDIKLTPRAPLTGDTLELDRLLQSYGLPAAASGNRFALYQDGVASYEGLIDVIESATHSLHYTTYILADDEVGRDIVRRLSEKAASGVAVRLLLDGVGTLHIRSALLAPLKEAGGEVVAVQSGAAQAPARPHQLAQPPQDDDRRRAAGLGGRLQYVARLYWPDPARGPLARPVVPARRPDGQDLCGDLRLRLGLRDQARRRARRRRRVAA